MLGDCTPRKGDVHSSVVDKELHLFEEFEYMMFNSLQSNLTIW